MAVTADSAGPVSGSTPTTGGSMLAAIADLGRTAALAAAGSADSAIEAALTALRDVLGIEIALVAALEPRQVLVHRAALGLAADAVLPPEAPLEGAYSAQTLAAGESYVSTDIDEVLPRSGLYLGLGAVSAASAVIRGHDRPLGVVTVLATSSRTFAEEELVFIRSVANIVGAALERERVDQGVRRQDGLLENLLEHAPDIVIRFDRELRHVMASAAIAGATGRPIEDFIGRSNRELGMPEELCALWERELLPVFETVEPHAFEFSFPAVDGERHYDTRVVPELGPDGRVETLLVFTRDITDAVQARDELAGSELRYRELFEHAEDMIFLLDEQGVVVDCNPAVERTLGYEPGELTGAHFSFFVDESRVPEAVGRLDRKVSGETGPSRYESLLRTKDGAEVPVETTTRAIIRDGTMVGVLGISRDLRERRRFLDELAAREELFRTAFEDSAVGMSLVGRDLEFIRVNQAFADLLGYSKEELEQLGVEDVTPPDGIEPSRRFRDRLLEGEISSFAREKRHLHKDGSEIWTYVGASAVRGPDGEIRFFATQYQDISSLKTVENQLRESQLLYRLVVENARDLIGVIGIDGNVRLMSASVTETLGWETEDCVGKPFVDFIHPDDHALVQQALGEMVSGHNRDTLTVRAAHRNGTWRVLTVAGAAAFAEDGSPDFLVVTCHDVTERERLEEELRQSQKLEAIGKLAGGVAHDFNNLLTAINGYSDVALSTLDTGDNPRVRRAVEQIRRAGERAAGLTQQLLAFSRRQTLRPEVVNINSIVGEYVSLLARVLGEQVVLDTTFGADLPAVKADPIQLGQVIMNLAVNARDAMPDGGTLRIETAIDESGAVNVIVSDTGQGIEPEVRARIFEPFFTTKGPGSGTGLGLATVLGIVEQSGGTIEVSSEPGQGSQFVVRLPATDEVTEPPAAEPLPLPAAGASTILLVEDEDVVRELVATILEEEGYDVVSAASPRQALRLLASIQPDLLLTDVVMPEMNGMELARQVLEQHPDIAVLYTSGYAADVVADRNVLAPTDAFIQKPYPAAALTAIVRRLLETHSRPNRELSSMKKTASAP